MDKLIGIIILVTGEVITIGAEIYGAKYFGLDMSSFKSVFWKLILPMNVGGALLLGGYMLSMLAFKKYLDCYYHIDFFYLYIRTNIKLLYYLSTTFARVLYWFCFRRFGSISHAVYIKLRPFVILTAVKITNEFKSHNYA